MATTFETVDDYIAAADPSAREALNRLRETIRSAVPDAAEKIRYGIPAIRVSETRWMHFAAWKHHVGVYPVPPHQPELEDRIAAYRTTTSTVRFPLGEPIPYDLVGAVASAIAAAAS